MITDPTSQIIQQAAPSQFPFMPTGSEAGIPRVELRLEVHGGSLRPKAAESEIHLEALAQGLSSLGILFFVERLHDASAYATASDILLNHVGELIEQKQYGKIDKLFQDVATQLRVNDAQYEDLRGQARVLTLLGISRNLREFLRSRGDLRSAFWDHLSKRRSDAVAAKILGYL